ncbi:hypothetical protein HHK36_016836 [Tetracentron sinense]|uniref:Uncharacterized protein n=1 Tax=Tetracentron sinense TaxID=13715 RepID=A0A834Z606_TETSI|nr:hypothetical protein HHK36_016836 [Tetracentron sinense]
MTEVLHSPSHFPSSPSSLSCVPTPNDGLLQTQTQSQSFISNSNSSPVVEDDSGTEEDGERKERDKEGDQLSLLALLVTVFRKSLIACKTEREELCSMEIGWPTDVRHVAHVTFDRFNGFLGLPVEFEPEVPRRAPSASASVFGVSAESMQLSYDYRGNIVPTILLLMQGRLYSQGGLQAEGIFRINAENSQEEYVRDQLNRGVVPDGIDVHCLAGLIKAWFRELPNGVLDSLAPEQVMQSQSEEECAQIARLLPQTEAALLDWAINLMADVVQVEHLNKMNARNIAMVFAPNMTQMADPLTALMYAVQVMNFLKNLIIRTLREREDPAIEPTPASHLEPSDENGHHSPSQPCLEETVEGNEKMEHVFIAEEPLSDNPPRPTQDDSTTDSGDHSFQTSVETLTNEMEVGVVNGPKAGVQAIICKSKTGQSSNLNLKKGPRKVNGQSLVRTAGPVEKSKGASIVSRINSRTERVEAWR